LAGHPVLGKALTAVVLLILPAGKEELLDGILEVLFVPILLSRPELPHKGGSERK